MNPESRRFRLGSSLLGSIPLLLSLTLFGGGLSLAGCVSGGELHRRSEQLKLDTADLHDAALRCQAERAIALAESNLNFGLYEMQRGKVVPAKRHIEIAERGIAEVRSVVGDRPECFGAMVVSDSDSDGIPDSRDNCPFVPNPDQLNLDSDEFGDACDTDLDGDGILNTADNCPTVPNPDQRDTNRDGIGDVCSADRDGDGLVDSVDRCPDQAEDKDHFEDEDGCPDFDNDKDGILDERDDCPDLAEDNDQYQDFDGCPEEDNDLDGIKDPVDQCPDTPEDMDGDRDTDGCPEEPQLVVMTEERIEISQQINFATNSDRIVGDISFQIMDEIVAVLASHESVEVRVEGHTDAQGSAQHNLRLSQARADSVRAYLVEHGVDTSRLISVGFGEEVPIEDNSTTEGRAANRRVEFHITKH